MSPNSKVCPIIALRCVAVWGRSGVDIKVLRKRMWVTASLGAEDLMQDHDDFLFPLRGEHLWSAMLGPRQSGACEKGPRHLHSLPTLASEKKGRDVTGGSIITTGQSGSTGVKLQTTSIHHYGHSRAQHSQKEHREICVLRMDADPWLVCTLMDAGHCSFCCGAFTFCVGVTTPVVPASPLSRSLTVVEARTRCARLFHFCLCVFRWAALSSAHLPVSVSSRVVRVSVFCGAWSLIYIGVSVLAVSQVFFSVGSCSSVSWTPTLVDSSVSVSLPCFHTASGTLPGPSRVDQKRKQQSIDALWSPSSNTSVASTIWFDPDLEPLHPARVARCPQSMRSERPRRLFRRTRTLLQEVQKADFFSSCVLTRSYNARKHVHRRQWCFVTCDGMIRSDRNRKENSTWFKQNPWQTDHQRYSGLRFTSTNHIKELGASPWVCLMEDYMSVPSLEGTRQRVWLLSCMAGRRDSQSIRR